MPKTFKTLALVFIMSAFAFRFCLGLFVIQPLGAIPKGATIVYWRLGSDFNFVESADGIVMKTGLGLSLWTRATVLGAISEPILKRELFRLPYSEQLYLASTNGERYER